MKRSRSLHVAWQPDHGRMDIYTLCTLWTSLHLNAEDFMQARLCLLYKIIYKLCYFDEGIFTQNTSAILFSTVLLLELTLTFIHLYPIVYIFGITWTPLLCVHHLFQLLRPSYILPHFNFLTFVFAFCFFFSFSFINFNGPCIVLALHVSMSLLTKSYKKNKNIRDLIKPFLDLYCTATSCRRLFLLLRFIVFVPCARTVASHQKYRCAVTFLSQSSRHFVVQRAKQVRSIAFFEYCLSLKFYGAENEGTRFFSRTVWPILRERKAVYRKSFVRTLNGLAKSGRSLVLSAKVFSGGDI